MKEKPKNSSRITHENVSDFVFLNDRGEIVIRLPKENTRKKKTTVQTKKDKVKDAEWKRMIDYYEGSD